MDRMSIVARFDGDDELAGQLAAVFLGEYENMLGAIRTSLASGEAHAVSRAAHAFKGSVANFIDGGVVLTAQTLEHTARDGKLTEAPALLRQIERELAEVLAVLRQFESSPSCAS